MKDSPFKSFLLSLMIINSLFKPFLNLIIYLVGAKYTVVDAALDFVCAVIIYLCYMYVDSKEGK